MTLLVYSQKEPDLGIMFEMSVLDFFQLLLQLPFAFSLKYDNWATLSHERQLEISKF